MERSRCKKAINQQQKITTKEDIVPVQFLRDPLSHLPQQLQAVNLDKTKEALKSQQQAEERIKMLAALPEGEALEKVMRYETHLTKKFARTLKQPERQRLSCCC